MRIISLLPAATEIVCALGLEDQLVGVSHACKLPGSADEVPRLTRWRGAEGATAGEVDASVRQMLAAGAGVYEFDAPLFRLLEPDLVLTQSLCNVCAVDGGAIQEAATYAGTQVWEWSPRGLADILAGIIELAELCGVRQAGVALAGNMRAQLERLRRRHASGNRPRVAFLEWLDPLFCAGHWIPELVAIAGGENVLGRAGERSRQIEFQELAEADPDVVIACCCGWPPERTRAALATLGADPRWQGLRAVPSGRVHVVDAETSFTCPGTSIVTAVEQLAKLISITEGEPGR